MYDRCVCSIFPFNFPGYMNTVFLKTKNWENRCEGTLDVCIGSSVGGNDEPFGVVIL